MLDSGEIRSWNPWSVDSRNRCGESRRKCRPCHWSNRRELGDKTETVCLIGQSCSKVFDVDMVHNGTLDLLNLQLSAAAADKGSLLL